MIVTVVPRLARCGPRCSAVQLDVSLCDRQAEAGACGFGRKIWLEDLGHGLLVHADAGVGDFDDRGTSARQDFADRRRLSSSATGHRVERILDHVGDRAANSVRSMSIAGSARDANVERDAPSRARAVRSHDFLE